MGGGVFLFHSLLEVVCTSGVGGGIVYILVPTGHPP